MASNRTYRQGVAHLGLNTPGHPRRRRSAASRPLARAIAEALEPRQLLSVAEPTVLQILDPSATQAIAMGVPPMPDLQPGSDSGISSSDNITNSSNLAFNVTANAAGVIHLEVDGVSQAGSTLTINAPGTYSVTLPATGVFSPYTTYASPAQPYTITVGDVNADGKQDLVAPSIEGKCVFILLGNGDGTFKTAQPTAAGSPRLHAALADFNGDGKVDLVTKDGEAEFSVFLGNGDGTFSASMTIASYPGYRVLATDINGDQKPDILVPSANKAELGVYLGKGDGTFQPGQTVAIPAPASRIQAADLNKDGHLDLVMSGSPAKSLGVLIGKGNGTFETPAAIPVSSSHPENAPRDFAIADTDNDGNLDIIVTTDAFAEVLVFAGHGDGTFALKGSGFFGYNSTGLFVADFNQDGNIDFATTAQDKTNTMGLLVSLGNGYGSFSQPPLRYDTLAGPFDVGGGDFTGTGRPSIVTASFTASALCLYQPIALAVDGVHTVTAWFEDLAGNKSALSTPLAVTIDTTPPPTPALFSLQLTSDTGVSNQDHLTDDHTPTFDVEAGPYFRVYRNGVQISKDYEIGTIYTAPEQADGTYTYSVRSVDEAGNVSPGSCDVTLTITSLMPLAPDLQAASDSGVSSSDDLTNFNNSSPAKALQFLITRLQPGALVTVYADGNPIGSGEAIGSQLLMVSDGKTPLADGKHAITWRASLPGQPQWADSPALTVTVDTQAPAAPPMPDLADASDTGVSNTDNVTSDNTPTIAVVGAPYYRLYRNGVQASGEYESAAYTSPALADGDHIFTAVAVDAAGNASPQGSVLKVTIDTTPPPIVSPLDLMADSDSGWSNSDNITNDNTPTFVVYISSWTSYRVYRDSTLISSLSEYNSNSSGSFTWFTAPPQPDGTYSYSITTVGGAGYESQKSVPLVVTIDTTAPQPPRVNLNALSDSGVSSSDRLTNVAAPAFDVQTSDAGFPHLQLDGSADIGARTRVDGPGTYAIQTAPSSFQQVSKITSPDYNSDVITADFTGDGILDFVTTNYESNGVSVYIGNGDGTFKPRVKTTTANNVVHMTCGDFNGDGKADLALVTNYDAKVVVLLGNGNGTFKAGWTFSSGMRVPHKITSGDLDGDGKLDLVVGETDTSKLWFFRGDGTGRFSTWKTFNLGGWFKSVVLADFNGDGKLDVAWGDRSQAKIGLILQDAQGNFKITNTYPTTAGPFEMTAGDFNGDGAIDIITADLDGSAMSVFLNNGDGTFKDHTTFYTGVEPIDLVPADFNHDGRLDLAVLHYEGHKLSILLGNGNGTFTLSQERTTEEYPWALAAGDFNRDGELDLIAAGCGYLDLVLAQSPRLADGTHSISGWMEDLAGNRSGPSTSVTVTIDTQAPATPGAPDLADASDSGISNTDNLTNDNTPTLIAVGSTYFRYYEDGKQLSGNYQTSSFTAGILPDGKHPVTVAAVDAAGNVSPLSPALDVTIDTIAPAMPAMPDLDAGSDTGVSSSDNITKDNTPTFDLQLAGSDYFRFYRDGKSISDPYQPASSQYTAALQVDGQYQYALTAVDAAGNQSSLSLSLAVTIDTVAPPAPPMPDLMWAYDTGISDSDNITRSTFVHFQLSASEAGTLYLGADGSSLDRSLRVNAAGTYSRDVGMRAVSFTAKGALPTHSALELAIADVNKDGHPDVLMVAHEEGLYLALGNGDGTFQAFQQLSTAEPPFQIVVADFNSDGNPDIAAANGTLSVLLGNGDGTFQTPKLVPDFFYCYTFVVADLNSDGHPDLLPVDAINDRFTVRLGNGDGTFRAGPQVPTGHMIFPSSLQTGDINGDGILDVLYRGSFDGTLHVHLGNGDGSFQPDIQTALTPLQPYLRELGLGDFNEDGKLDIVLTGTGQPAVFLKGNGDGTFTAGTVTTKIGPNPEGMAVGDFNEDGHLDFAVAAIDEDEVLIVAGFGDGTFDGRGLYAVGDNPADIYAADLNGDGKLDMLTRDLISSTATVLLNTSIPMPDGPHQVSAWFEDLAGNISPTSAPLTFTLDTTRPAVEIAEVTPDRVTGRVEAITITFSEPVAGFDLADLKFSREDGLNLLTAAQSLTSADHRTWVLGNLAGLTNSVGSYTLTLAGAASTISDLAGNPLSLGVSKNFTVSNTPPVLQPIDNVMVDEGSLLSFTAQAEDRDLPAQGLTFSLLEGPAGAGIDPATGVFTWTPTYEQAGQYTFRVCVRDDGEPSLSATQPVTITVKDVPPLQVRAMSPTPSGFDIQFSGPIDRSKLNLYDGVANPGRAADLTVVGQKSGPIAGSMIWDSASNVLHFVKTGSLLVADTYTLMLFSRGDGFVGLDGDGDGRIGGDYSQSVTVAAGQGPIVSLPDIARGPNQSFALPMRISSAAGVLSFTGELQFDPTLLNVNELALAPGLPANWTVLTNVAAPGRIEFVAYGATALSGSGKDLLVIKAAVPADAPYGTGGMVKLVDVQVNDLASQGDTAVVAVAYLGDASGNGSYGGLDAGAIAAVAVGAVSGFDAYPLIDPRIIGDVNGNGSIGGLDASLIAQKSVGIAVPQIPDLPVAGPVAFNRVQTGSPSAAAALFARILRTPSAGLFSNEPIAAEW